MSKDKKKLALGAHVVVGTPGRVKQLLELNILVSSSMRMLVVDEADQLFEEAFQDDVEWIIEAMPERKQVFFFFLNKLFKDPRDQGAQDRFLCLFTIDIDTYSLSLSVCDGGVKRPCHKRVS